MGETSYEHLAGERLRIALIALIALSGGEAPGSMQKLIVRTQSHRKPDLLGSAACRSTCSNLLLAAMQGQLLI